ncbi:hypothetical protein HF1_04200 [Mycoplasma haemofelis str. Langford 1]|uniref:Uncharacterized protein n=1 Tax=Mycoplasma haemofelis (strain Langford 1) TaxID=941640 RepID=E8ZH07_MYCHL|nr:hypothetical protein [Mycoplasma haemofelis]CBY92428.1 hypothetical protein HF1_04200 [Mycoplasma haemofelis str. Langford 1]
MALSKKVGFLSTASVGGISGSVALAHYLSSGEEEVKNVIQKLKKEHFTPISEKQDWETMLVEYNKQKGVQHARFINSGADATLEDLKAACEQAAQEDISNSRIYSKFKRWCTIPKTILNHLSDHGLHALKSGSNDVSDKGNWEKLKRSYLARDMNSIYQLRDKLKQQGDESWKLLQSECETMSKEKSTDVDFDFSFKNFKEWCTKEAADKLS